jgi:hypothetical protein
MQLNVSTKKLPDTGCVDEQTALPEHIPRLESQSPSSWQSLKDSLSLDPLHGGRLPLIHGLCLDDFLLPLSLTLALSYSVAYNMCKGREVLRLWEINVDLHLKEGRFAGPMLCQIAQASLRNVAAICSWIIDIIQRTAASAMSRHLSLCTYFKSTICAVMVDTLKH